MPKDLSSNVINEFSVFDKPSQSTITLFYRKPKNAEFIQYQSALVNTAVKNKDSIDKVSETLNTAVEWALKFITGFKKGSYVIDGKEISSDEKDVNYYPEWKELLRKEAFSELNTFVNVVLGEPNYVVKGDKLPF